MSNIFNDPTETQLNERTINLQNLSVLQPTLPILDIDNVVTGQIASSAGLALLNITSIADLRSQILENDTEEAIRLTADSTNEINFYTNGTTASELRMQITDATTSINNTLQVNTVRSDTNNIISFHTGGNPTINNRRLYITNELIQLSVGGTPTTLTVDEADGRIIISEMLTYENHTGVKLNFYKDGKDSDGNLYEISVDTTGNNKIIYKSPNDHLFRTYDSVGASDYDIMLLQQDNTFINNKLVCNTYAYNDGSTYPTYLSFDAQHAHITAPSGLMLNGGFNITNGASGTIATTNGNKDIDYKTHGTGTHNFYVNTTTQVLELDSTDSTFLSTNLKTNNIVSNTDNTYSIGTSSNKYSNIYGNAIETGTIRTPTNTHLEVSPNGSGNIRTNRRLEIPAGECIMLCKENNKHFQLNLAPNNEAPNSASDSYGSGLSFWSSFFSQNDAAPRLFANINCRTTGTNWEGGRLDFRVRVDQNSGTQAAVTGDAAELNSLQMTITATTVDILKRLNVSSHIIPSTDNTSDLGELTKRFRNGYIEKLYVKENRVFGGFGAGAYIDLRGVGYDVDGEGTTTSPIYFNTGYNGVFGNFSETRKSMIIGSGASLPTGENNSYSRNNIVFCVSNAGDNAIQVSTSDERFRIGQVANYTSVDILPRNANCDLGSSASKYNYVYTNNIETDTINTSNSITLKNGVNDLLLLNNTETTSYKNILPNVNNDLNLGSSSKAWGHVFTNLLTVISTISSATIYSGTVQAPNINPTTKINFTATGSSLGDKILLYGTTYKIGISSNSIDYTSDVQHTFKIQTTEKMRIAGNVVCSTNLIPGTDNSRDLGNSNNRWQQLYAGTTEISTSDRTKKKEIDYENIDKYANELLKLKPCSYKFIDGTSNIPHTGLIAQDLEGTMFELSGAYIKDRKKKTIIENGISKEVDVEGFNYGLRYSELISPIIRLLHKQQEKITQLEQMNEVIIKLLSETLNK